MTKTELLEKIFYYNPETKQQADDIISYFKQGLGSVNPHFKDIYRDQYRNALNSVIINFLVKHQEMNYIDVIEVLEEIDTSTLEDIFK